MGYEYCAVFKCHNTRQKGFKLFSFPNLKKPGAQERTKKWIHNMRTANLDKVPMEKLKTRKICQVHFEESQFKDPQTKKSLIDTAVPTLFVTVPNPPPKIGIKRQLPTRVDNSSKIPRLDSGASTSRLADPTPGLDSPSTSTNTGHLSAPLTPATPREKKLEQMLWKTRKQLQRAKKTMKILPSVSKLKLARTVKAKCNAKIEMVLRIIKDMVPIPTKQLIHSQLLLSMAKTKGKRFTSADKITALGIYYYSQKAYKYLAGILCLPTIRTLQRMLQDFDMNPGFHQQVLHALKLKVSAMTPQDKYCAIVFDEMSLKTEVVYNSASDRVEGLEDFGSAGRTKYVANSVVVFTIRGLKNKWKQPVGYFLTSGSINSDILNDLTHECIRKIRNIGLIPKVLICDQGPNNRKFLRHVTEESPVFSDKYPDTIYVIYDPPHLVKNVRNNFKRNTLSVNGEKILWEYLEKFYNFDKSQSLRLAPKLTKKHVYIPAFKEMRVCLAAQVLSHTVAAGMSTLRTLSVLPQNSDATIDFIDFFDQLFDLFNSRSATTTKQTNKPFSNTSQQQEFINMAKEKLHSTKSSSVKRLPCIEGWLISLHTLQLLWADLNKIGFKYILTNRLNQDLLENFFSIIRGKGGHRDNPNSVQFRAAFRQASAVNMLSKSYSSNCMEDGDKLLVELGSMKCQQRPNTILEYPSTNRPSASMNTLALSTHIASLPSITEISRLPTDNVAAYMAGYILSRDYLKWCDFCHTSFILPSLPDSDLRYEFIRLKTYEGAQLTCPTVMFIEFIKNCDSVLNKNLAAILHTDKLSNRLSDILFACDDESRYHIDVLDDIISHMTCMHLVNNVDSECVKTLRQAALLFFRVKIHHILKHFIEIDQKQSSKRNRKFLKLSHS